MQVVSLAKDEHAAVKGDSGDHLFFLLEGSLQVVDVNEDGRKVGLFNIPRGDYFGEMPIIDRLPHPASVVAREKSLVGMLPRTHALELITGNPLVAKRVLLLLSSTIRAAADYRNILGKSNAFKKVFALLLQFAKPVPGGLVVIENMPTQQDISIMLNTSRETVSRAVNRLIDRGIIEKDFRRLIVRKPEALLKAITQGDD